MSAFNRWLPRRLQSRLIVLNVGLIVVGFAGLALFAGRQISTAARQDYEARMRSKVALAAEALRDEVVAYDEGRLSRDEMEATLAAFEAQVDADLALFPTPESGGQHGPGPHRMRDFALPPNDYAELAAAREGVSLVVERTDAQGVVRLYTATEVKTPGGPRALLQLSEPASRIESQIARRWLALGGAFALVTGVAVLASLALAFSLTQPLRSLQEAAQQLAQGNLSHRVPPAPTEELNNVARAFNTMARQVQGMIEEQRAFASNSSHELRTPLTTMRLRTEALRYDTTLDAPTRAQYVAELDDELRRLGGLIEDLILLARLDAGRAEVGMEEIDFASFAESMVKAWGQAAADKNITLRLHLPAGAARPVVRASVHHLNIVFRNVLDNALKYTPAGGHIEWGVEVAGGFITSRVQDSGQGIAPAQLAHVFDRFYRGDRARSRQTPGSGLGLALVKAVVEAYGGTITVSSAGVDKGTLVRVVWKAAAARK